MILGFINYVWGKQQLVNSSFWLYITSGKNADFGGKLFRGLPFPLLSKRFIPQMTSIRTIGRVRTRFLGSAISPGQK